MPFSKPILIKKEGVTIGAFNDAQTLLDFLGYSQKSKFFRGDKTTRKWRGEESNYTLEYQSNKKTVSKDLEKKLEEKRVWHCEKHYVFIASNAKCPLCEIEKKR